ncbi:MAG: branched-chain amino acid ABC transporter substrate-binding protein, partial [Betaproteobacteria bacterium]
MLGNSVLSTLRRVPGALFIGLALTGAALAQQPLKIGFGMSLTGPLAGNGKAALIAMEIWRDDVNAKGGILGRKVEFVYYDDQTSPATVPSIYTKLLDVDKVDLVVSGYGTNVIAPAMPIIMQRNLTFMTLFGLNVNSKFNYDRYFQIMPAGPNPAVGWSQGFFDAAMSMNPKPKTVALVGADAEYPAMALEGAREHAKKTGLKIVYDKTYPPNTVDYSPIVRAIQAANPEVVFVASYP